MTFPSQDMLSSTTNSELLTTPTLSDFLQGACTHSNACASSYSQLSLSSPEPPPSPFASTHTHIHSRRHLWNFSVFFLWPGLLLHSTIAEDGAQELEISPPTDDVPPTEGVPMPSASLTLSRSTKRFGEGFTSGGRPPPIIDDGASISLKILQVSSSLICVGESTWVSASVVRVSSGGVQAVAQWHSASGGAVRMSHERWHGGTRMNGGVPCVWSHCERGRRQ
jgi:hypothetical protein